MLTGNIANKTKIDHVFLVQHSTKINFKLCKYSSLQIFQYGEFLQLKLQLTELCKKKRENRTETI